MKKDAETWLLENESRKRTGTWTDPRDGETPVGAWIKDWWPATAPNLRPGSVARDESYMKNHVLPRWKDVPLAGVEQIDVRRWVVELSSGGLAPATVRLVYHILSRAMDAAVDARMIPVTPCRRIPLPRIDRREMRFLEPAELVELVTAIDPHYRTLVNVAAYIGLRWGELAGLRVHRVDLLHRKLSVVDQLTEVRGTLSLGQPLKTRTARRTVALPRFLVPMLEEQISTPASQSSGLLFASSDGNPMRRSNFARRVWAPAVRATGLDGLRFHDLRHSAVAFAIAQGAHPKAIQQRMGHSSIIVTMDLYGHLFPHLDEAIADGLDDLFARAIRE